jgi:hypothetical protein
VSRFQYNGLELDILKTVELQFRDVYSPDGADYLYTHVLMEFQGLLNPAATAYDGGVPGLNPPVPTPGAAGSLTLKQLKYHLLQPRKRLAYVCGANAVVVSPRTFTDVNTGERATAAADANNGPHPIAVEAVHLSGTKSILVSWRGETWVSDLEWGTSPGTHSPLQPVLCHRWSQVEGIERRGAAGWLSTVTTRGYAIFRSDLMLNPFTPAQPLSPDDFRKRLFLPVRNGFIRESINCGVSEDNLRCEYEVKDVEVVTSLDPAGGISDVKCRYLEGTDWTSGMLPMATLGYELELWGRKNTTRAALIAKALGVFTGYGVTTSQFPLSDVGCVVDMEGRYIKAWSKIVLSGYAGAGAVFGLADIFKAFGGIAGDAENIPGVGSTTPGPNIAPPGDGGTRGALLPRLVAQALTPEGADPAPPTDPGQAKSLTFP